MSKATRAVRDAFDLRSVRRHWRRRDANTRLVSVAATVQLLFGVVVVVDESLVDLALIRPLVAVPTVALLPGVLVLAVLNVDLDSADRLVHVVSVSLVTLMFTGVALTLVLTAVLDGFTELKPFRGNALAGGFLLVTLLLTAVVHRSGNTPALPIVSIRRDFSPVYPFALLLPLLAILGATLLKWYDENALLIVFFALVGVTPFLVYQFDVGKRGTTALVWGVGTGLLLQKTLATYYLSTGDAPKEFYYANRILNSGVWDPTLAAPKNGMLSVVVLHPAFSLLADIDLLLSFKIVHPLLFGLTGVALFRFYSRVTTKWYASASTFFVLFLHMYFVTLAGNTRTAYALFFVIAALSFNVRSQLIRPNAALLTFLAITGIVVSHYGTGYLFMGVFGVAIAADYATSWLLDREKNGTPLLSPSMGGFYLVVGLAWYTYTTSGNILGSMAAIMYTVINRLNDILMLRYSSGGHAVTGGPESFTFTFIKGTYLFLVLFAGIGFAMSYLSLFVEHRSSFPLKNVLTKLTGVRYWVSLPREYLFLSVGGFSLFFLAFAPVSAIGIGRIYILAFPLLSPLAVLGYAHVTRGISRRGIDANVLLAVLIFSAILINSGTYAALTTTEASPQPQLIERSDEELHSLSQLSIYHTYYLQYDVRASKWILNHRSPEKRIYGPIMGISLQGWYTGHSDWNYQPLPSNASDIQSSYIYLPGFATDTEKVLIGRGSSSTDAGGYKYVHFRSFSTENVIYTNGESRVVYVQANSS